MRFLSLVSGSWCARAETSDQKPETSGSAPGVTPRPLPGVRAIRTSLRTTHLLAFGSLYGGHIYGIEPSRLVPALLATLATGGVLMALEMYRTPLWLGQVRGVATLVKIALVAAVAGYWGHRVWLLTIAAIIGGVVSHMPGRYRYYSLIHGRPIGTEERG